MHISVIPQRSRWMVHTRATGDGRHFRNPTNAVGGLFILGLSSRAPADARFLGWNERTTNLVGGFRKALPTVEQVGWI